MKISIEINHANEERRIRGALVKVGKSFVWRFKDENCEEPAHGAKNEEEAIEYAKKAWAGPWDLKVIRAGAPRKASKRPMVSYTVAPETAAAIEADRREGESKGMVLDRWAKDRSEK